MKVLVLFSGTGSIEKNFSQTDDVRGLDIVNKFKPYYNTDILKWDYKTELTNWTPDYIHASPVCSEFSYLKNNRRNIGIGMSLVDKSLEIIDFVKKLNPNLKFTIENPKGFLRKQACMKSYNRITTSYCKYDFPYRKDTDFWYGGFKLNLKTQCTSKESCDYFKKNNTHYVIIGITESTTFKSDYFNDIRITDMNYHKELIKFPEYKDYTPQDMRYRIPNELVQDIIKSLNKPKIVLKLNT